MTRRMDAADQREHQRVLRLLAECQQRQDDAQTLLQAAEAVLVAAAPSAGLLARLAQAQERLRAAAQRPREPML